MTPHALFWPGLVIAAFGDLVSGDWVTGLVVRVVGLLLMLAAILMERRAA